MAQPKIRNEQLELSCIKPPYSMVRTSVGSSAKSITSGTYDYIDSTLFKLTITPKFGKLIKVTLTVQGIYNSATNKTIRFDIGLGGTSSRSDSGQILEGFANWGDDNWQTDGSARGEFVGIFYFEDVGTEEIDFYPLWNSQDSSTTANIAAYSQVGMYVEELYMPDV